MGDLATDTAVDALGDGRFRATLSPDWEIWGPMGGYVAACALRAVGAAVEGARPASFSCHFLNIAEFGDVDLLVEARKRGRAAASYRVELTQGERPILDAMVWTVSGVEGLEHDETVAPDVPGPDALMPLGGDERAGMPFWDNLEARPIDLGDDSALEGSRSARWQEWVRFVPDATIADPWVDAARAVVLVDLPSWPAAVRPHAAVHLPFTAPTLDLHVAFERPAVGEKWLLCDGESPLSTGGMFAWTARVWSIGGRLHASGGGHCLYRRIRQ